MNINLHSIGFKVLAIHLLDLACINAIDEVSIFQIRYKLGGLSAGDPPRFHGTLESWTISLQTVVLEPSNFFLSWKTVLHGHPWNWLEAFVWLSGYRMGRYDSASPWTATFWTIAVFHSRSGGISKNDDPSFLGTILVFIGYLIYFPCFILLLISKETFSFLIKYL